LLRPVWGIPRHRGVYEVFRAGANRSSLEYELQNLPEPDAQITAAFAEAMRDSPLREETFALMDAARRAAGLPASERERQFALLGNLRRALARCCVNALEPDLVILDEFQRFSELLDGESDAAELAQQLFSYANERGEFARVLLLSATPYRSFSHSGEDGTSHHAELRRLLTFLYESADRAQEVELALRHLRDRLLAGNADDAELTDARVSVERALTDVVVRTERLANSATRNGMLVEREPPGLRLDVRDVRSFAKLARLHRLLRDHDLLRSSAAVTELWKSAPWLAQFMEHYKFKQAIDAAVDDERPDLGAALADVRDDFDWNAFRAYEAVDPGNARLRSLAEDTVDQLWDLLWLPPSMPYHRLGPPFDRFADMPPTKRLVFSSWAVVPRVIAGYLSYDAERRVHHASGLRGANTADGRKHYERRLLDFRLDRSDGGHPRPASMTTLGLLAPSATLVELGDPRRRVGPELEDVQDVERGVAREISERLAPLKRYIDPAERLPDASWYWAAPLLLDRERADGRAFWASPELARVWTGDQPVGTENFDLHVAEAQAVVQGGRRLGPFPDDLAEVLAQLAIAGAGTVAARALRRMLPGLASEQALTAGARLGWGWRHVFNAPEAIAAVEATQPDAGAYWRQALSYSLRGGLQAVMDEWLHLVAEDAGAGRRPDDEVLRDLLERALMALDLGASRVEVDPLDGSSKVAWRTHFAVRYGQSKEEGSRQSVHPEAVRRAFNSPLRPFVLASTSVGQEGLDFHTYCHAIVHWNLPANPVDLEQREGRVHRYKGHAVRKNVAERFGAEAIGADEPWAEAFKLARDARPNDQDDLVPYWLQPGSAQIERYVPALPFSRDAERYARVRRQVTLYRMVFGQPRQDDLLAYLQNHVGQAEAERIAELIRIDLSPRPTASVTVSS
jgi:hypothetical protein